jgi:hypothetical protein
MCFFTISLFAQPVIKSFSPTSGPVGTAVTIKGKKFSVTPSNNIVYFGTVKAIVSSATDSSLIVMTPVGATCQPISVTTNNLTAYSLQPFVATFPGGGTSFNSNSFGSEILRYIQGCPYVSAIGDIDNDGKNDIIFANGCSNGISILRNTSSNGLISFANQVNYSIGSYLIGIAVGDLNGDGKLDIAASNFGANTISVIKNTSSNGTISFATKETYATGENPYGIAIRDLDADGKPDIVVANEYTFPGTISILKNTSTIDAISFASKIDYEVGDEPRRVTIGDLDGDKKPDIVVANQGSSSISVLKNISDAGVISFSSQIQYSTTSGSSPESVSIGNLNNDKKPDMVVANNNIQGTVSVFKNTSSKGVISFSSNSDYNTEAYPYDVYVGDLNGDNNLDIVVANQLEANNVSIFRNINLGNIISLDSRIDYATKGTHISVSEGDLDEDGKSDIILANNGTYQNSISILKNIVGIVLPLNLLSFNGSNLGKQIELQWQTTQEQNVSYYEIQRSLDARSFNVIGLEDANNTSKYLFIDNQPLQSINYYRLKTIDRDGQFSYSKIIAVNMKAISKAFEIYPNPVKDLLHLQITVNGINKVSVFDIFGRKIAEMEFNAFGTVFNTSIDVSRLLSGNYFIILENKNGISSAKFVKE